MTWSSWSLANVEDRASSSPGTFQIPARFKRAALRVGDLAKLVFVFPAMSGPPNGERMWVQIELVEGGRYRGRLRNNPVFFQDLKANDPIEFGPEHVADWEAGEA
jgi:Uncharacterized protein conserved in bacteria (DUF2314)